MKAFLLRFKGTLHSVIWLLRCTAAIITGLTLAFVLWVTFQCTLVESQWDPDGGVCASQDANMVSVYVLSNVSAVTELFF
jgi:hypothetical protein